MKFNVKSIAITLVLLLLLGVVIVFEIGIFISGPARKYESDIAKQEARIEKKNTSITRLERNVFYYTTYVGMDKHTIYWFNTKGIAIESKKKSTLRWEKVKQIAKKRYHASNCKVTLGYGYDNPVYVIQCSLGRILLDYDTLKEVYFLEKGDV